MAELYERYRVPVGEYLYRENKNKSIVANTFNALMLRLVTERSLSECPRNVAIKLFSMAYSSRLEYRTAIQFAKAETLNRKTSNTLESHFPTLSRLQRDILELLYQRNFKVPDTAQIINCDISVIQDCLRSLKNQNLSRLETSNASRKLLGGGVNQIHNQA